MPEANARIFAQRPPDDIDRREDRDIGTPGLLVAVL